MAFFENSHGMQINGGNFYNIAGGMNVQQQLPFAIPENQRCLPHPTHDSRPTEPFRAYGPGVMASISGVRRSVWEAGSNRHRPYDSSGRRQITADFAQLSGSPQSAPASDFQSSISETSTSFEPQAMENALESSDSQPWTASIPFRESVQHEPTTTINGGTFVSNNTIFRRSERGIDLLHSAVALAALHDSGESFPQPKCHPETRTKILDDLQKWSLEKSSEESILWLYGPAGAGKSAIMQTFARQLHSANRLGGSFFFKRGHATRGDGKALFTTIAYQLALGVSWLKAPISRMVENDPSLIARSIDTQLQKLISEPSQLHTDDDTENPVIIVIDGLDECEGHVVQEEILRAIRNSTSQYPIPLRFIVASRSEPHIRELFESPLYRGAYRAFNVEQSFEDVRTYLRDEFARIHSEHRTMATIPGPWPAPNILEELVSKSSGHFIYASTVIKFIDDKNHRPTERLAVVQGNTQSDSAFDALDDLYMKILSCSPRQDQLLPILCAIANFDFHPRTLDRLLGLEDGETRLLLRGLHSLLHVPDEAEKHFPTISLHHASFPDFLGNATRSHKFYIGGSHHRLDLARSLLELFTTDLENHVNLHEDWNRRSPLGLIPLVISLSPCAELLLLIQRMNPDYAMALPPSHVENLIVWLRQIPGVPKDLVTLWEDYDYMSFCIQTICHAKLDVIANTRSESSRRILSRVPGLFNLIRTILLVGETRERGHDIRLLSNTTWDDLKTIICALRPIIGRDNKMICELVHCLLDEQFFGESYPWPSLSRDLARQLIRIFNTCGPSSQKTRSSLPISLSYLVRASPHCPDLLADLWTIRPLQFWVEQHNAQYQIYHISMWLESFHNSELLAFLGELYIQ
ncbi:NACHT domain-containing protein [Mycena sanguinolenta]|uniref:NACHT domain-containing protein n=1 Tax=Mycena sanguinolenta TaxID=230812 RepID=A0A8H7D7M2_9AGAR|nr:NACHT domain-containing protein [Mycena sanguinolenta]